jgi:hypothetical protein
VKGETKKKCDEGNYNQDYIYDDFGWFKKRLIIVCLIEVEISNGRPKKKRKLGHIQFQKQNINSLADRKVPATAVTLHLYGGV